MSRDYLGAGGNRDAKAYLGDLATHTTHSLAASLCGLDTVSRDSLLVAGDCVGDVTLLTSFVVPSLNSPHHTGG